MIKAYCRSRWAIGLLLATLLATGFWQAGCWPTPLRLS